MESDAETDAEVAEEAQSEDAAAKESEEFTEDVYSVETVKDLENITINKDGKIAVMAGASTPKESIEDVKKYLENL